MNVEEIVKQELADKAIDCDEARKRLVTNSTVRLDDWDKYVALGAERDTYSNAIKIINRVYMRDRYARREK